MCQKCHALKSMDNYYRLKYVRKSGVKTSYFPYCKQCHKAKTKLWRQRHREVDNARRRERRRRKKMGVERKSPRTYEEVKAYKREYYRTRYGTDPTFNLIGRLRSRLNKALRCNVKSASTETLIGICAEECRKHIESQFTEGMSWHSDMHVDHIVPCASFDLSDPQEQRKCFHWTNLRPMWGPENLCKSDKMTKEAAQREWDGEKWVDRATVAI